MAVSTVGAAILLQISAVGETDNYTEAVWKTWSMFINPSSLGLYGDPGEKPVRAFTSIVVIIGSACSRCHTYTLLRR